jgi:glycosyltransferase involved in cell wall biosynthesis
MDSLPAPHQPDVPSDAPAVAPTRRSLAERLVAWPKRVVFQALRRPFILYARSTPRRRRPAGEPTVYILIASAYGMGGTIRAALNLAGYLAQHHRVEVISVYRYREMSFFGAFPPGVKVTALDDRRRKTVHAGLGGWVRKLLSARRSLLVHSKDKRIEEFNLWTDVQLVRRLRGLQGWLVTTRPGLNLVAAELGVPGLVTIGQEQMHLGNHPRALRNAMVPLYPRLDALAVLTERDVRNYREHVGDGVRLVQIPNTVRAMDGPKADLAEKTVLAAGRFAYQKGFDLLLPAWAQIAADHPDWRLRLCGSGNLKKPLRAQIKELGLTDSVSFEGPADMAEAMAEASIFALSSRFEGFPLILLEAMSKGMAVVSFDCPTGPGEIIDDHRNGLLVPELDVDGFAAALRELIDDEDLRRSCGAAAVATADAYTMEAIGPRWHALLDELWRARHGAAAQLPRVAAQSRAAGPDAEPAGDVGAPVT